MAGYPMFWKVVLYCLCELTGPNGLFGLGPFPFSTFFLESKTLSIYEVKTKKNLNSLTSQLQTKSIANSQKIERNKIETKMK